MNQFSVEARERLSALQASHARSRAVCRVAIEWLGVDHPRLPLAVFENGRSPETLLARCQGHGAWLEWLADEAEAP